MLNDAEFQKLVAGKANAQKLFMSGKLKVKGDVMKGENVLLRSRKSVLMIRQRRSSILS